MRWILPVCAAVLASCGDARVHVANKSSSEVSDVQLIARGTIVPVGVLTPGQERTVAVCPKGESSLMVKFRAAGKNHEAKADTYFECDSFYELYVAIKPDLSVTADYPKEWSAK